ncbi:MAG TPA: DUF1566 domain-containing protein [Nitrospirota bacterium]|nr:DUF1566 domain-containing protein [Nitrospirota bacterium]
MFKQRELRDMWWKTALIFIFMLGVFSLRNTEAIGLQANDALFTDVLVSAVPFAQIEREMQDPTIRRSRHVHGNFDLLKDSKASLSTQPLPDMSPTGIPQSTPVQKKSITLNLFNDVSFTAVEDRMEERSANRYTWYGHIEGIEQSHVILVNEDGDMAGAVFVGPGEQYQVRPIGGGVHAVYDVDTSAFPPEAEPIPVYTQDTSALSPPTAGCCDSGSTIDVMVVYTSAAAAASGNIVSEIQLAVDQTNTAYANSLISQRLRLVHTAQVTYTETGNSNTDLTRLQSPSDGYMDDVHTLREAYHADVVSLLVESMTDACGRGYQMTNVSNSFESLAFNVVDRECATSNMSYAHELGHNMGAEHDRANGGQAAYSYSYGHVASDKKWRTLMAYASSCSNCPRITHFSNPGVTYSGVPTGIPEGQTNSADNAKTLNNTAYTVANFRQSNTYAAVTITATDANAAEPSDTGTYQVTRSGSTSSSLTVYYSTSGTATAGSDYNPLYGSVAIPAGYTSATITVTPVNDTAVEGDETVIVTLNANAAYTLGSPGSATVTIADYDSGCTVPIGIGQTMNGGLVTTDCMSSLKGNSYYADRYSFTGSAGQDVAIYLTSTEFDTYLYLIDQNNTVIAYNDDGGGGTNSRIPATSGYITLPSNGSYVIEVTSYYTSGTGNYTLSLTAPASTPPRTGQTTCYDSGGNEIACTGSGQDGEIQAGIPWPNPRFTVSTDGYCVTDNLTGLMWVKSPDSITRTWQQALDYANGMSLCGYTDWRLPNVNELKSMVNAGQGDTATWLNTQGFSNVQSSDYWSSTSDSYDARLARTVSMWVGFDKTSKSGIYGNRYVWPVRSGQSGSFGPSVIQLPKTGQTTCYNSSGTVITCTGTGQDGEIQAGAAWPSPRYTVSGDCVTDNLTGLMWTKNANLPGSYRTWQEALDYANGLSLCGYTDWRLPNVNELSSHHNSGQHNTDIWLNSQGYSNVQEGFYWSSTSYAVNSSSAWFVVMWSGGTGNYDKSDIRGFYVWPVRSGQVGPSVHSILGTVTENGIGRGGVTMTLSGCASAVTDTAPDGSYSFTNLTDGDCTVTPSLYGYAFIPPSRLITVAGADVSGQDFSAIQTWFEEDDPAITYTGTWNSLACNPCNNVFLKYSGQTGATAEFSFYGTGIKWHTAKAPALGKAKIYFDGAYKGMVDLYRSTVQYPLVLGGSGIPPGNHTLTIEVSGQKNAGSSGYYTVIDGFEVVP